MILCFDIGNTDIYGGVCRGREVVLEFRKSSQQPPSADEFGVFRNSTKSQLCQAGRDAAWLEAAALAGDDVMHEYADEKTGSRL